MDIFLLEHQVFLRQLVDAEVDFILIGGYAVIYYGYGRSTGDLDVWVNPNRENWMKVMQVLRLIGFDETTIAGFENVNLSEAQAIMFDEPPYKVDILTKISLVEYPEAKQQALHQMLNNIPVDVLHLHHLILSKINTGRTKDAADIEELQRVMSKKGKSR